MDGINENQLDKILFEIDPEKNNKEKLLANIYFISPVMEIKKEKNKLNCFFINNNNSHYVNYLNEIFNDNLLDNFLAKQWIKIHEYFHCLQAQRKNNFNYRQLELEADIAAFLLVANQDNWENLIKALSEFRKITYKRYILNYYFINKKELFLKNNRTIEETFQEVEKIIGLLDV